MILYRAELPKKHISRMLDIKKNTLDGSIYCSDDKEYVKMYIRYNTWVYTSPIISGSKIITYELEDNFPFLMINQFQHMTEMKTLPEYAMNRGFDGIKIIPSTNKCGTYGECIRLGKYKYIVPKHISEYRATQYWIFDKSKLKIKNIEYLEK